MSSLNENVDNAKTEDGEVPNNEMEKGTANLKETNHEDDNDEGTDSENDIEEADKEELGEEEDHKEEDDEKEDEEDDDEDDESDKAENHEVLVEVEKADYNANKMKKGKTNTGNIKQTALMPSAHAVITPAVARGAGNKKIAAKKVEKTKKKETLAENMLKRNGAALTKPIEETSVVKPKMRKLAPIASAVIPATAFKATATTMAVPELFQVKVPIKNNDTTKRIPTQIMVDTAIKNLNERAGSSLYAIKKYILSNYSNVIKPIEPTRLFLSIKKYIKKSLENGNLIQQRGSGLSGSFKLVDPKTASKAKAVKEKQKKRLKQTIKALKEKDNEKAIEKQKQKQKQQPSPKINVAGVKRPRKGGENMAAKTAATTKSNAVAAESTKPQPAKKQQTTGKTVKEKENTNPTKKKPAKVAAEKVAAGAAAKKKEPHVAKAKKPAPASTVVAKPARKVKPKK